MELLINSEEPEDTYLMTVVAIDPDFNAETAEGEMTYALSGGDEIISIDSLTGEVSLTVPAGSVADDDKTFRVIISVSLLIIISKLYFQHSV